MHLRSLTLKGFKSFPDRTRLEFSPGVSVIVGPNGSGKSNVTDAVLWAMGEQSPLAIRGASMQDVIFAGAHGVKARAEAEVEVVIDNGDGRIDLPMSEIAITRRIDRTGEGEYRINGARCRLIDVLELLSDTGLGKEMHSVVSQGKIGEIVTSKPLDRRRLIEEAAGLGKHRKRRRRAQLKLDRTQDNLDRALDVEREARTRLRPLKRQAEAAELHERLARQTDEARWSLVRDDVRSARAGLDGAEAAAVAARSAAAGAEQGLSEVAARRQLAEASLAARGSERDDLANAFHAARSAHERVESSRVAAAELGTRVAARVERRRGLLAALEAQRERDVPDEGAAARIEALEVELGRLAQDAEVRLAADLERLEVERTTAREAEVAVRADAEAALARRREVDEAADAARRARRDHEQAADRARREAARVGAELAKVNGFLRAHAGAPGGATALADALRVDAGYELALAAVLGTRLRAGVASSFADGEALLERAGRDGGTALVLASDDGGDALEASDEPVAPVEGAERLGAHVRPEREAPSYALVARALADVWVVASLDGLPKAFVGVAVTPAGRVWSSRDCELRQVPAGGEDRVLAQRNSRDGLVAAVEAAARVEHDAQSGVEAAAAAVRATDARRDEADRAARATARLRDDAAEALQHAERSIARRRRAPAEGEGAERRVQLQAAVVAERRLAERAERERQVRSLRIEAERVRGQADAALVPQLVTLVTALEHAAAAIATRVEALGGELSGARERDEALAAELRACAATEAEVRAQLRARGEEVTRAEVGAQRARDAAADAELALTALAERLGLETDAAETALADNERATLVARIERLNRRREQLGPVNPLAQDEYAEAIAHVEELERQREDLEAALRELAGLIRDTDRRIREAFEETFAAASANFEEVVGKLFPGGRGRLRLVHPDSGPRAVIGGADAATDPDEAAGVDVSAPAGDPDEAPEPTEAGVELEITPAGKATKRLSLLSGGEKSMTALAFLFAVFLAKPCPFYILDEVEAALDDVNVDRFLGVLHSFSDRAQFIVVTHQKRTMEAADCLYGVSMAGNGVSKVVSRRLPPRAAA